MALVRMRVSALRTVVGGRYRLGERVGDGAAGTVWQAWDTRLGRTVAVKQLVIPPGLAAADARRAHADAAREGRIAARLQHPAVAGMLDMVVEDGSSWLVMEYVAGCSLAAVLERSTLTPLDAARIGAELADALAVAHAAGVVHSDVKPANVLLREDGTVKLADFGIARVVRGENLTGPGVLSGTPLFMAPEVARGQWPDDASDVYSLAGTLYAAVEGTGPFGPMDHDEPLAMIRRVAETTPLRPRRAGALTEVLAALLVADPSARPSAAATRDLLREIVAPGTAPVIVAPSTARPATIPSAAPATPDRVCRAPRRGRALTALSKVGVVGVGAVAGSVGGGPVMSLLTSVAPAPLDRIAVLDGGAAGQAGAGAAATGGPGPAAVDTGTVAAPPVPAAGAPIVPDSSRPVARADVPERRGGADDRSATDPRASGPATSSPSTALPIEAGVIEDVPLEDPGRGGVLSGTTSTVDDVLPIDLGASSGSDGLVEDLPVRLPVDPGTDEGPSGLPVDLSSSDGLADLPVELGSGEGPLGLPVDVGSGDGLAGLPVLPVGSSSDDSGDVEDSDGTSALPLPVDLPGGLLGGSSDADDSDADDSDADDSDADDSDAATSGGSLLSGPDGPLSVLSFPVSGEPDESSPASDDADDVEVSDAASADTSSSAPTTGSLSSTLGSVVGSGSPLG